MINEAHDLLFDKIKFHYPDFTSKRDVLRRALRNYRTGKGLSLEYEAFKFLNDSKRYEFIQFARPSCLQSRELVLFDNISPSPYYVGKKEIWISDPIHQFTFEMVETFDDFLQFLRT